jgi:hypothetical protein
MKFLKNERERKREGTKYKMMKIRSNKRKQTSKIQEDKDFD